MQMLIVDILYVETDNVSYNLNMSIAKGNKNVTYVMSHKYDQPYHSLSECY